MVFRFIDMPNDDESKARESFKMAVDWIYWRNDRFIVSQLCSFLASIIYNFGEADLFFCKNDGEACFLESQGNRLYFSSHKDAYDFIQHMNAVRVDK